MVKSRIILISRYDADSQDVAQPTEFDLSSPGGIAQYGGTTSTYASAVYGSSGNPVFRQSVEGSGFVVAFKLEDKSTKQALSLRGFELEYVNGGRR